MLKLSLQAYILWYELIKFQMFLVSKWKGFPTHQSVPTLDSVCKSLIGRLPKYRQGAGHSHNQYVLLVQDFGVAFSTIYLTLNNQQFEHSRANWFFLEKFHAGVLETRAGNSFNHLHLYLRALDHWNLISLTGRESCDCLASHTRAWGPTGPMNKPTWSSAWHDAIENVQWSPRFCDNGPV